MKEIILNVSGMHCEGCEKRIKGALKEIKGVKEVTADHKEGTVTIKAIFNDNIDEIKERLDDLGFEIKED